MDQSKKNTTDESLESLEGPSSNSQAPKQAEQTTSSVDDNGVVSAEGGEKAAPPPKPSAPKQLMNRLLGSNIYLVLFIFILIVAGGIAFIAYAFGDQQSNDQLDINAQKLTADDLKKLASSGVDIGSSEQILNVQSNAIFSGKVLARSDIESAGNLSVGGDASTNNLNATGSLTASGATLSQNLAVTGNIAVQGQQTIAGSLQVGGGGTFNGPLSAAQISTSNFQLSGNLNLTRHIAAAGPTPTRTNGPALGAGGTASVSGSDTAGTIAMSTGSSPAAGCFATVTFAAAFNDVPAVIVTPVGAAAGSIAYYVTRNATSFSVCTNNTPPANASFSFDFMAFD